MKIMEEDVSVVTGRALGYRSWRITEGPKNILLPLIIGEGNLAWNPGENRAICYQHTRSSTDPCSHSPGKDCDCGLNAYNQFWAAHKLYSQCRTSVREGETVVFGAIAGYGNTRIHIDGWRAEKAEIIAFLDIKAKDSGLHPNVQKVADRFDVPAFSEDAEFFEYSKQRAIPVPLRAYPYVDSRMDR